MKLLALLALLVAACGSTSSPPPDGGLAGADGATDTGVDTGGVGGPDAGAGGAPYPNCPQHRVEGPECPSSTAPSGVLRKDGLICASCSGVDSTGMPTAKPVGCTTIAGGDLCVADCGECS